MPLFDPLIGKSLIGAGANLVSGLFGFGASNKTNQTNIQLQREQQAWNEKMWNMNNAYNTPVQQVKRLKDAGLNVGLMYSGGQGDVGNSSSPAQSVSPAQVTTPVNPFGGVVDSFSQVFDRLLQQKVSESTIALNGASTLKELSQSKLNEKTRDKISFEIEKYLPNIMGLNNSQALLNKAQVEYTRQNIVNAKQQLENLKSQKDLTDNQKKQIDYALDWADHLYAAQIHTMYQNANSSSIQALASKANSYYNGRRVVSQNETDKVLRDGYRVLNKIQKAFGYKSKQYEVIGQIINNVRNGIGTLHDAKRLFFNTEVKAGPFGTFGVSF